MQRRSYYGVGEITAPANSSEPVASCLLCGRRYECARWVRFRRGWVCDRCAFAHYCRRLVAFLIDVSAFLLVYTLGLRAVASIGGCLPELETLVFCSSLAAFLLKDGWRGKSPGKALLGLRVINRRTLRPASFGESARRNVVFLLTCCVGVLLVLVTIDDDARFGEVLAGTMVIEDRHRYNPIFTRDAGHCRVCGYNLTGNVSGVCPECGTITSSPWSPPSSP